MKVQRSQSELDRSQCGSSSRRSTRSQVAPDWNPTDELLLVNEIAAVEADCLKALSSFQKWKIISQNCSALGVPRTLDQYRRKWDALFLEYKSIKQWESASRGGASYWVLEIGRRKQKGLPENFDNELFRAIDNLVRVRGNQSDTDPDSDPEAEIDAEADVPDVVAEPESKRRRRRSTHQKSCPIENSFRRCKVDRPEETYVEEKPEETHAEEKPQETHAEEKPVGSCLEVIPQKSLTEEKSQKSCAKKHKNSQIKEKAISIEEQEQIAVMQLHENVELIQAIVNENADHEAADVKSTGDPQTDLVRRQGEQVIACLGDIVKTLDQLRQLVQECE